MICPYGRSPRSTQSDQALRLYHCAERCVLRRSRGGYGVAGAERRGQEYSDEAVPGFDQAHLRRGEASGRGDVQVRREPLAHRVHAGERIAASERQCVGVPDAHGAGERPAALPCAGAFRRYAASRWAGRGALPPARRVLNGHEAAREVGAGTGTRSGAGDARRADGGARPCGAARRCCV